MSSGSDHASPSDPLIVAIDFGTTYSGVAWVRKSDEGRDIPVIRRWPGRHAPQVRTDIEYDKDGKLLRWGYMEAPTKHDNFRFTLMKSLLPLNDQEARKKLETLFGKEFPTHFTISNLIADYLKNLYKHVMEELEKDNQLSGNLTEILHFVITYPALWSKRIVQQYKDILESTEIGKFMEKERVYYLCEQEAAMIGTLHSPHRKPPASLTDLSGTSNLSRIAILDAGGGTLDFAAYDVKSWDPLDAREIAKAGELQGGSNVDIEFWNYFQSTVLDKVADKTKILRRTRNAMLREFETVKHCFPEESSYILRLPVDPALPYNQPDVGIEDGHLYLKKEQMKKFFDTVANKVIDFLEKQGRYLEERKRWKPKAFFLVGGFGDSQYLQDKVKRWVERHSGAKFMAPGDSWTVVVTGAAKYGLYKAMNKKGPVQSRVSDIGIGVVTDIPWKQGQHSKDLQQKTAGNMKVVRDQIKWLVGPGGDLRTKSIHLEKTFSKWPSTWTDVLVQSEKDKPSSKVRNKDHKPLGEIKINTEKVPSKERERSYSFLGLFGKYYRIKYQLDIKFPGADMVVEMHYKGKCYGKCKVRFASATEESDVKKYIDQRYTEN